eukprot:jgi/Tetstr1/459122/TSEL_004570.t2
MSAFGGFGSSGFGGAATPAFGSSTPAFGAAPAAASPFGAQPAAASSPFGAANTGGGFGQSTGAFGTSQTPAFGGGGFGAPPASPAFGAAQQQTPFGAKPAGAGFGGFGGGAAASPFGAQQSTPAFGATTSTPGFGAAAPSGFGGGISTPSFGQASAPAFGAASPTPAFGSTSTAFGAPQAGGGMFGAAGGAQATGTRSVPYQKTIEQDQSASSGNQRVTYNSISNMPQYQSKSVEELRFEDYSAGCKGNTGAAAPAAGGFGAAPAQGGFGQQMSSPFGASPGGGFGGASTSTFGAASQPAFGAASPPTFGAAASQPTFGGGAFGASPTPSFGAAPAASTPFGAASTSTGQAFGGGSAFGGGGAFGASSAPAFGASSAPVFGASSPFGATSAPAFGAASTATPTFGAATPGSTGLFGASAAPALGASNPFGASSAPAFGGGFGSAAPATSTPGFGGGGGLFGAPASSTSLFGAASTPAFGQGLAASTPFGAAQPAQASSLFGSSTPSAFGAASQPNSLSAFGQSSTGLFGAANTGQKPAGGGLFGQSSPSMFGGFSQAGAGGFGTPAQAAPAATPPGIAQSPYGALPATPSIGGGTPASVMKVGISQRPAASASGAINHTLITPRTITPRSGVRMRPRRASTVMQRARESSAVASPVLKLCSSATSASPGGSLFTPRDNPRRLFIREPPPSTSAASGPPALTPAGNTAGGGGVAFGGEGALQTPRPATTEPGTPSMNGLGGGSAYTAGNGANQRSPSTAGFAADNANGNHDPDAKARQMLPVLRREDYYMKPSLETLSGMAREDPEALGSVRNFTIGRHGFGSVQWLEPVDVRGLRLDAIVHISHRELEVYPEDSDKPPAGDGLNKPARVTLLKVFKMDKATGKPSTDEKAVRKFRKKLVEHTAAQDSRFLSYDGDTGEWAFEVEHFSRYGLADDDSDDEVEGMDDPPSEDGDGGSDPGLGMVRTGGAAHANPTMMEDASPQERAAPEYDVDMEGSNVNRNLAEYDSQFEEASLFGDPDTGALDPPGDYSMDLSALGRGSHGSALAHTLPAALELDLGELVDMQAGASAEAYRAAAQKAALPTGLAGATASRGLRHAWQPASMPRKHPALPQRAALRAAPLLSPPRGLSAGAFGSPAKVLALPVHHAPRTGQVAPAVGKVHSPVDAALLLGRSFRVGWGPNGVLAVPKMVERHEGGAKLVTAEVEVGPAFGRCAHTEAMGGQGWVERTKSRLVAALRVHNELSATKQAAAGEPRQQVPLRALASSRARAELETNCGKFLAAAEEAREAAAGCEAEVAVAEHEMGSWLLLLELFADIDCSDAVPAGSDDGMATDVDTSELAAIRRRAKVSALLRHLVFPDVQKAVMSADSLATVSLAWLTGQQAGPALAAAAVNGDVRLATMMAAAFAGGSAVPQAAKQQLDLWAEEGFLDFVPDGQARIYRLLAGEVAEAVRGQAMDWRRSLGLYLWYAHPPTARLSEVLQAYWADVAAKRAAMPIPKFHSITGAADPYRGHPGPWAPASVAGHNLDAQFALLCLAAGMPHPAGQEAGLGTLLCPAAHTPDPFDHTFGWMLGGVLQAIGAVDPQLLAGSRHSDSAAVPDYLFRQCSAMAAHLEMLGEPMWALYVACHLPDHPLAPTLRDQFVVELLARHAPSVLAVGEAAAEHRLCKELGIPATWLASAAAQWADYQWQPQEHAHQLIAAQQWDDAHAVVFTRVAPSLFLSARQDQELCDLLGALEPHLIGTEEWSTGAGLFSHYIKLEHRLRDGVAHSDKQDICAFGSLLATARRHWLARHGRSGRGTPGPDHQVLVAISHMAETCAAWEAAATAAAGAVGSGDTGCMELPAGLEAAAPNQQRHHMMLAASNLTSLIVSA